MYRRRRIVIKSQTWTSSTKAATVTTVAFARTILLTASNKTPANWKRDKRVAFRNQYVIQAPLQMNSTPICHQPVRRTEAQHQETVCK